MLFPIAAKLPADILLKFYARYKQAREGPCNIEKPGFFNFQAKGVVFSKNPSNHHVFGELFFNVF